MSPAKNDDSGEREAKRWNFIWALQSRLIFFFFIGATSVTLSHDILSSQTYIESFDFISPMAQCVVNIATPVGTSDFTVFDGQPKEMCQRPQQKAIQIYFGVL